MSKSLRFRLSIATTLFLSAAALAIAHDPKKAPSAADGMCGEHHSAAMKASEATTMHLAEAKRSGTLAAMRKHVEAAEKAHAEMEKHLSTCMEMMHKHGGMMGEGKGMMSGSASSKSSGATTGAKVIDPVCGMEVDSATAVQATYAGKTYYFCSEGDKAKFQKNPESYVGRKS